MQKLYSLLLLGAVTLAADAAVPFAKGLTPPRPRTDIRQAPQSSVLVDEDFSKFSEGTESAPGEEISTVNGYNIPDSLTAQPGWRGGGLHPAGGAVAITPFVDEYDETCNGFISTPAFYMGGTTTLTFRAKCYNATTGNLWTVLCDDYYGPGEDQADFALTQDWQEYTLVARNGSFDDPSYFQFKPEYCDAIIDDIRIEFVRDRLPAPYAMPAINNSTTEFTARWEDAGTPSYRLNVYRIDPPENFVEGTIEENFDGIAVNEDGSSINASQPCYPEGWTIKLTDGAAGEVSTVNGNFNSAPLSLILDSETDSITSPVTPEPMDAFSFWVKPSAMQDDPAITSLLRIDIYHSTLGYWETIAHLPYYWMEEDGIRYEVDAEALRNDATQVRLSVIQFGEVYFFIDDFKIEYSSKGHTNFFIKDAAVTGTEYTVSDIDPTLEHFYYVQSVDGDIVADPSSTIWVDGLTGLSVTIGETTDVNASGFTANWEPLGHATSYRLDSYKIVSAKSDMTDVTVLEESFDAINEGTLQYPGSSWISPFDFGAKGWASTGWSATNAAWIDGMAGTMGITWYGAAGLVYSPYLNLSANGNQGFDVEATVVTTVDNFELEGETEEEGVFVMVLNSVDDSYATTSGYIATPKAGSTTARVNVPNPEGADLSHVIVAFMNKSGTMFFVDNVKIIQNLKAGETLTAPLGMANTTETSYTFTDLDSTCDHGFSVTASATHAYETYVSNPSDIEIVTNSTVGVENVLETSTPVVRSTDGMVEVICSEGTPVAIYTLSGVCAASWTGAGNQILAPGLYIVKAGGNSIKVVVK